MEIKKKLQKGLLGIVFPGLLAVSGCNSFSIGGMEPVDRRKVSFGEIGDLYAREEILKFKLDDSLELTDYYMSRGMFDKACIVIDRAFKEDGFSEGNRCLDQAEKYVKKFNIKGKDLEFLKDKYKVEEKEDKK